jgi:hypothetical protein
VTQVPDDDAIPQEVVGLIRRLVASWSVWKWIFGGLAAIVLVVAGWMATTLWDATIGLAKVEAVPAQVEAVETRLREVEKSLGKLDDVPADVKQLGKDSVQQADSVRKATVKVTALEESIKNIAAKLESVEQGVVDQGKATKGLERDLTVLAEASKKQLTELAELKEGAEQLRGLVQGGPAKRLQLRLPLAEMPSDERTADKAVILVFRNAIPLAGAMNLHVESIELIWRDEEVAPTPLIASGELDYDKKELVVSIQGESRERIMAALEKSRRPMVNAVLVQR